GGESPVLVMPEEPGGKGSRGPVFFPVESPGERLERDVRWGIGLLDVVVMGWRRMIDLDTLKIGDRWGCSLGQVFGSFEKGREALSLTNGDLERHGFLAYGQVTYADLTLEWKRQLSIL